MKPKQTKSQLIAELQRKLQETEAQLVHLHHFADVGLDKAGFKTLTGSGAIVTITALGGREIVKSVLIRDGLSDETIKALRADISRSYQQAIAFKPRNPQ